MIWKWKRPAAFLLAAAMIFTMPGVPASAVEAGVSAVHTGLCKHHPEHTENCGFTEGTEGAACEHEHIEDCYTLVKKCVHEHDESCYPVLEESISENTATPSEAEKAQPTACTHECSEESGCITKELSCLHERGGHDDTCGYIPTTEGTPCGYICEQCNSQDSGLVPGVSGNAPGECICETRCEKEAVNPDCPVCSAENADLSACLGKEAAVLAVQALIDALPETVTADNATKIEEQLKAIDAEIEALTDEQVAKLDMTRYNAVYAALAAFALPQADHTHCVCGGNGDVNGHEHDTAGTEWTTTDSLPDSVGNYYLTQSVSESWTVPTGEVNLCLNGQTISGSITVGSGATLTLTDCSDSGRVQGEVLVNGGKLELYSGTITGGVQVGKKGADYQIGSSFTMYGGAITGNEDYGGVFLVGTTNYIDPPSFTMHGGTISDNTAGASDGGGGGVYVGEKCSFTMDGGTITGNTATAGNGGGIYIHFNAGNVSISNATITDNKASATGNTSYGHGGGIYSERGVTVKGVTITGNNSTFEGGGIYGKGAITLTDATVTGNNQYDVYYDGGESTTPELTVSGLVKAGYYANFDWKLPIRVSGALSEDSVIRVGVYEGIKPNAGGRLLIAEPASDVTLRAKNFEADAADCVTSLGDDGKVYLVPCKHEMDDTGYTCSKCGTQFDARVGESAYYQTLTKAFDAARGNIVTLLRDVTLTENCSSPYTYSATLDLNGKTVSSGSYPISVGGGNNPTTLTVKDSGTGGGTQALDVTFYVSSNGTLAVDDSYTGEISRVELQAGGALERFGGEIGELVLSNAAYGSTSTGYGLKLWKGNTNACTIGRFKNTTSKILTVKDLLGTDYAKCELYGEKGGTWSIVDKSTKIVDLTGYTAYKVQFPECVHRCDDDSNPVCSVCNKNLYTKITAKAADGTTKTAYFTADSALEHGYVEAIQTLNGWSNEGCTEPTLTLLRNMDVYNTSMPLTGTLTLEGGTHTAKNVTVAENANVTFASGSYRGATIDGTAMVKEGVTFTTASVTVNGTLNAKGGTFNGPVKFNGSSIANISGGNFTNDKLHGGVEFFNSSVTGTISGGTFVFADFYTTKVKLSGGTFKEIKSYGDHKLADLLAEGAAYYGASDNQAVTNDGVNTLENVKVVSHTHNGGTDGKGICSVCKKQMAASLTVGGKTSWYAAFASAIEAANAADGEKTITLYQDVNGYADGHSTTYELTHGPVTLATGGKTVTRVDLIAKGISLTVTGSNGDFNVTVDGKDAELTVNDGNTKLAIVTAQNGGKLSLSNGTFSRVAVKDDGSSASLSGGSYGAITSDAGYVKPYALLAKGYAYKKTTDNEWLPNANSIPSKVTVEKAPFAVEKIYPNSDTNYTGSSAFATDGNITLTAVIASEPETENVTYTYWWELFNESTNDWTTIFRNVNTATHTGGQSKTLTITGLPVDKSYQYHIFVQCSNGYNCYSEPFTVTRHQHSWTYTASGATITAKCSKCSASGGSVTIAAPAELTYSGEGKPATVTASSDWQGPAASGITISYIKSGTHIQQLENGALPTNAGTYTASITLDNATASVTYTIGKATPKAEDFTFTAPTSLTYDGNVKSATVSPAKAGTVDVIVKYYDKDGEEATPKNAGEYTVKIDVAESTNYAAANGLTADGWKFSIIKAAAPDFTKETALTIVNGYEKTYTVTLPALPTLETPKEYGAPTYELGGITLDGSYYTGGAKVENGKLILPIQKNDVKTTGPVGTVTVVIKSTNYKDITLTVNVNATNKLVPTVTAPTANALTYNGAEQALVTAGKTTGGTMLYRLDDSEWSEQIPTAKNAGEYTVWYKVQGNAEYADVAEQSLTVTVAKKSVTVTAIDKSAYTGSTAPDLGSPEADKDYKVEGLVGADTLSGTVTLDYAQTPDMSKTGETAINITGTLSNDNYEITYVSGTLTVSKQSSSDGGSSSGGSGSSGDSSSGDSDDSDNNDNTNQPEDKPQAPVTGATKPIQPDKNGNAAVDNSSVQSAIDKAKQDAKKNGTTENGIAVTVPITQAAGQTSFNVTIKAQTLDLLVKENVRQFTVATDHLVSVNIGIDTLKQLDAASAGGDIILRADKVDALRSTEAKAAIGTRPAYDLSLVYLSSGKETPIANLNGHNISVRLPYTPAKGEQTGNLYAVYVDDAGKVEWITRSSYDASQKAVVFETGHFSVYGIGYKNPAQAFTDITGHWAADNILFVASRGLLSGISETTFSPDTGMTRGMFVTALGRLAGINPGSYQTGKFTDVKVDAYYAPYVNWAAQNGIVEGVTATTFTPDTNINREQMAVIMANYAKKLGYDLPQTLKAVTFADNANISSWAKDAVRAMQQAGILAGKNGNKFDPKGTATRAEVATVLRRFVKIVIDSQTANGWQQNDSGQWSYYRNGKPVKGWLSDDQKWYWLVKATGMMFAGGWKQIDGKWYYFYTDGTMAVNTTIDGYTIGSDGARK